MQHAHETLSLCLLTWKASVRARPVCVHQQQPRSPASPYAALMPGLLPPPLPHLPSSPGPRPLPFPSPPLLLSPTPPRPASPQIDLGGGHVLEFVMAPNLHWPDTMFSFDHATRVMYTCDAFGMHYCAEDPYDSQLAPLEAHYRFYYDCLMLPNAKSGGWVGGWVLGWGGRAASEIAGAAPWLRVLWLV